jgi:hypothetical protein
MKGKKGGRIIFKLPKGIHWQMGWARKLDEKNMDLPIQTLYCFKVSPN